MKIRLFRMSILQSSPSMQHLNKNDGIYLLLLLRVLSRLIEQGYRLPQGLASRLPVIGCLLLFEENINKAPLVSYGILRHPEIPPDDTIPGISISIVMWDKVHHCKAGKLRRYHGDMT